MQLVSEGLIEVYSGRGTFVAERGTCTAAERGNLLKKELEQLVVEAKKLEGVFAGLTQTEDADSIARRMLKVVAA